MGEPARLRRLTAEEYLREEANSPVKRELVEGVPYAMAGAGRAHNLIVSNLHYLLYPLARRKGCRLYVADMKLKVGEATFYYPDLMAVCAPPPKDPLYEEAPCLVVEVLSPATEGVDRREKLWRYLSLPSLEGYLLVSARERRVELYRKEGDILHQVAEEGEVPLPCLEGSLPVAEVYAGVELEGQEA
ncbi:Uma2 family endonuclease [Thermus thermophilus]|nr:Uma2 family endonuclease [Thermus thermophilus]